MEEVTNGPKPLRSTSNPLCSGWSGGAVRNRVAALPDPRQSPQRDAAVGDQRDPRHRTDFCDHFRRDRSLGGFDPGPLRAGHRRSAGDGFIGAGGHPRRSGGGSFVRSCQRVGDHPWQDSAVHRDPGDDARRPQRGKDLLRLQTHQRTARELPLSLRRHLRDPGLGHRRRLFSM